MRKTLLITPALVLFAAIVAPTVFEGQDIDYTVNQTVGIGSMTGTITTDGTIGTLTTADTIGWNLTITDGTTTLLLTPSDSFVFDSGSALSATATALIWNYSIGPGTAEEFYAFYPRGGGVGDWVSIPTGINPSDMGFFQIYNLDRDAVDLQGGSMSGTKVIASVQTVPEGGGALIYLLLAGASCFGAIFFSSRNRFRKNYSLMVGF
jgi:hypothetical protein